jgi:hypothetical protein
MFAMTVVAAKLRGSNPGIIGKLTALCRFAIAGDGESATTTSIAPTCHLAADIDLAPAGPQLLVDGPATEMRRYFPSWRSILDYDPEYSNEAPELNGGGTGPDAVQVLRCRVDELQAQLGALKQRLEAIAAFERLHDALLTRPYCELGDLQSHATLDARDFLDCVEGVHFLEYVASGVAFRWTGPGHFTRFRFRIDRQQDILVRLRVESRGRNGDSDPLTVDVDGSVYPLVQVENTSDFVAGPIPPRPEAGFTDVILHVPQLFSPEAASNDNRVLGIAVISITVEPAA